VERQHMQRAIDWHTELTGERPWAGTQGATARTHADLLLEQGGFLYDSDSYADDLPLLAAHGIRPAPGYPLHPRLQRHALCHGQGFNSGEQFFHTCAMPLMCSTPRVQSSQSC
jgi:allantoinase